MADFKRSVGSYEILETLGKGGYSWVKKGRDDKSKNFVALKFMARAEDAWAADQAQQVRTEIKSLTQVKHENVMKLYAYNLNAKYPEKNGNSISTILLVLEYCPGGELFDILYYTDKLDEKTARTYFQMMIQGIKACHDSGITHRDIKPQNLLLDKNYNLKLTDFGLSKINDNPDADMKTTYVGTRGYQAPELLAGKKYNKSCDVFSAGVVLFILLTGYPPFEQGSKKDKWYRPLAKNNETKFWKQHQGCQISDTCQDLLVNMLAYKPMKRFTLEQIESHAWYKADVHTKDELKGLLRKRHRDCMKKRKEDANKQTELVHSVKRDIPKEYIGLKAIPEVGEPGLINVIELSDSVDPFQALWRSKEILEAKSCTVDWDKAKPLQFNASFETTGDKETKNEFGVRCHVRFDAEEKQNYMEFKRTKAVGVGANIKFRKILNEFMVLVSADKTFNEGFNEDGTTRLSIDDDDEKKEVVSE